MFRRVFVYGIVAAADVTARFAQAQMNPIVAGFQTILAAVRRRRNRLDRTKMHTGFRHNFSPSDNLRLPFRLSIIYRRSHYKKLILMPAKFVLKL